MEKTIFCLYIVLAVFLVTPEWNAHYYAGLCSQVRTA